MSLQYRAIKWYELHFFLEHALREEGNTLLIRILVLIAVCIFQTINLLLLTLPFHFLQKIVDIVHVQENGKNIGGYMIIDKRDKKGYVYFGSFFILTVYQNQGRGKKVLDDVITRYSNAQIRLDTRASNKRAQHVFSSVGFKTITTKGEQVYMAYNPTKTDT